MWQGIARFVIVSLLLHKIKYISSTVKNQNVKNEWNDSLDIDDEVEVLVNVLVDELREFVLLRLVQGNRPAAALKIKQFYTNFMYNSLNFRILKIPIEMFLIKCNF